MELVVPLALVAVLLVVPDITFKWLVPSLWGKEVETSRLAPGKVKGAILSKAVQPVVSVQVLPSSGLHPAPFTLSKYSLLRKVLNVHLPFWCVRCLRALTFEPRLRKMNFRHRSG